MPKGYSSKPCRCRDCGVDFPVPHPSKQYYCQTCSGKRERDEKASSAKRHSDAGGFIAYNRKIRLEVITHYGLKCACCGETHYEFLCIDHINNDGAQHRKSVGSKNLYTWIRTNNFPSGLQVLCDNCNASFGRNGYCPHHPEITRPNFRQYIPSLPQPTE